MDQALEIRTKCQEILRRLLEKDEFLTRYALYYAIECLDLVEVNNLVDAVQTMHLDPDLRERRRLFELEQERFRPSRLS